MKRRSVFTDLLIFAMAVSVVRLLRLVTSTTFVVNHGGVLRASQATSAVEVALAFELTYKYTIMLSSAK